jgi:peptide-methionine (S)-S-oxide reductase
MFKIQMRNLGIICVLLAVNFWAMSMVSCADNSTPKIAPIQQQANMTTDKTKLTDTATFGAGCFWCVEAVYQQLEGVISVTSGYSGGSVKNPTYKEVCSGLTGHAEVCQIVFDPSVITYADMLQAFWMSHDPTTLNRQGNDVGTQYRSVIYYQDENQKQLAEKYKKELDASHAYANPLVTEISPLTEFYVAEDYHQNYYNENGDQPYCQFVVKPKVEKFQKVFKDKLKKKAEH